MLTQINKKQARLFRKPRIRAKLSGTAQRPRLVVFKSNTSLYAQLIDDTKSIVIGSSKVVGKNIKSAEAIADAMLNIVKKHKIQQAIFDRNGYQYHGIIKTFTDKMREGGLKI